MKPEQAMTPEHARHAISILREMEARTNEERLALCDAIESIEREAMTPERAEELKSRITEYRVKVQRYRAMIREWEHELAVSPPSPGESSERK